MTNTTYTKQDFSIVSSEGSEPSSELIKTDRLGRILIKPEHREALLDKFESSGMSAMQFAKLHGVKYTTFACWRQKRNTQRNLYPEITSKAPDPLLESLAEVVVQTASTPNQPNLEVQLGGKMSISINTESSLELAAKLIQHLQANVSD